MRKRYLVILIVWFVFIFIMSNMKADSSSDLSGSFIDKFLNVFNITDGMDDSNKLILIENLQFLVRKTAHFTIYFITGILFSLFYKTFNYKLWKVFVLAVISGGVCALIDEFHQLFIPGRTGKITDVLLDSSGVLFGCVIVLIVCKLINRYMCKNGH